jgi:hypothetical protein
MVMGLVLVMATTMVTMAAGDRRFVPRAEHLNVAPRFQLQRSALSFSLYAGRVPALRVAAATRKGGAASSMTVDKPKAEGRRLTA